MKKLLAIFLATLMILSASASALANTPGERIGDVLHTDIRVFINDVQIMGFNINGWTYVVAEELSAYGFTVLWNEGERRVDIMRGQSTTLPIPVPETLGPVGSVAFPYVYTDIQTFMDGALVHSYNIQGRTVVPIDSLAYMFGDVVWHEEQRELHVRIIEDDRVVVQQPVEPDPEPGPEPQPEPTPSDTIPRTPLHRAVQQIEGYIPSAEQTPIISVQRMRIPVWGRDVRRTPVPFGQNHHAGYVSPTLPYLSEEDMAQGARMWEDMLNPDERASHWITTEYADWFNTFYMPHLRARAIDTHWERNRNAGIPETALFDHNYEIGAIVVMNQVVFLGMLKTDIEAIFGSPCLFGSQDAVFDTVNYIYGFGDGEVVFKYSEGGCLVEVRGSYTGFSFGGRAVGDQIPPDITLRGFESVPFPANIVWSHLWGDDGRPAAVRGISVSYLLCSQTQKISSISIRGDDHDFNSVPLRRYMQ